MTPTPTPSPVPLTVTDRGTDQDESLSGDTTSVFSPSSNYTAGALAVLCVAYDNRGVDGADPFSSISDSLGNTWTSRLNLLRDPGAANNGMTLRIFTTPQDAGTITTGTVVTITTSLNGGFPLQLAATFIEVSGGGTPQYISGGGTTGNSTTPSTTTDSLNTGEVVIGAFALEGSPTVTPDSDTTNGNWSTQQYIRNTLAGAAGGYVTCSSQQKVVTGTGTQSYDIGLSAGGDWCIGWIKVTN